MQAANAPKKLQKSKLQMAGKPSTNIIQMRPRNSLDRLVLVHNITHVYII